MRPRSSLRLGHNVETRFELVRHRPARGPVGWAPALAAVAAAQSAPGRGEQPSQTWSPGARRAAGGWRLKLIASIRARAQSPRAATRSGRGEDASTTSMHAARPPACGQQSAELGTRTSPIGTLLRPLATPVLVVRRRCTGRREANTGAIVRSATTARKSFCISPLTDWSSPRGGTVKTTLAAGTVAERQRVSLRTDFTGDSNGSILADDRLPERRCAPSRDGTMKLE